MPTIPKTTTKTISDVSMCDVVNAVRNSASEFYKSQTVAVMNQDDLKKLYAVFDAYDSLAQEFMGILWSRVAKIVINSKLWNNPLSFLKKGEVELGEVIEEAFINPAKPHVYDDRNVEDEATLRREPSEMYSTFYIMNYKTFYKTTIWNDNLKNYFLSWDGVESLIAKMTESLYNGAYQDEYMMTKYMVGQSILNGWVMTVNIGDFRQSPQQSVVQIKEISNDMIFVRTKYNRAGVKTYTRKDEQFFFVTSAYDAVESVEVQAAAFNLDKVQFEGQRILIDSLAELDIDRLNMLNKLNPDWKTPTADELKMLDTVAALIIDRDWFQIYDNLNKFTEQYNAQKLFWNYFLHVWRTFASSPFANAVALVNGSSEVTAVTVSPAAVTLTKGQGTLLSAEVMGNGFINKGVSWSSSNPDVTVGSNGYILVSADAQAGSAVITATSNQDNTVQGTAQVTITA